jgi:hypothetical protein
MASGNDARLGVSKETVYGTRVTPARFFPFTAESLTYEYEKYNSQALGVGRWTRPTIRTKSAGAGSLEGEVSTTGFSYLLDALHGNTTTPVIIAAGPAYTHTHTLSTAPDKSYSIQVQTPPVTSSTLVPHDLLGVMFSGITLSWDDVLTFSMPASIQALSVAESLASYVAPTAWNLLSFRGGSISIGGVAQSNIVGGGSISIGASLRTGVHYLGSTGLMAKPTEIDKPSASGTVTADFTDNTHLSRTINDTIADVVLRFEGATILGADEYSLTVTIPDCEFTSPRPTVGGPGPVAQPISFSNASTTNDPVTLVYVTTDTAI